ncbi:oxygen-insensitive NADPH nitroreductase [Vreelandella maris]|uniref:Oxygen-insensitive NADPH nitroreductase n=1 Tax=Vreelandella maris TaxID=2729617 RepID=A0A7Y6VAZ7_9GAMM|nr:oxygen-insensitive NADPH nitroreductase [Halomonas maris]NVF16572.1 oxygen-insensitive NADPH nitroreductase [Halomonas maris]|tara:strand:- start:2334 stop:3065 length:732 start_codon:yes stop_codon:yes gene_type:complete
MNDTIKLLQSHRSIRKFEERDIPKSLLRELVCSGQAAATSSHIQAYSIIHVTNKELRNQLVELTGGQKYVASSSDFLVFCADMKRPLEAAKSTGENAVSGMTEQLLVATVDVSLVAQNIAIAAESKGLGICYIGGIRNNPQAVSDMLSLPQHVYPVFGMCIGYPAHDPDIKPRLPVEAVLKENNYSDDTEYVNAFNLTMYHYYQARKGGNKMSNWSQNLAPLFNQKLRSHMQAFLVEKGFEMK